MFRLFAFFRLKIFPLILFFCEMERAADIKIQVKFPLLPLPLFLPPL